jgi:putative addiction module component (TIGR02574 family)
MNPATDQLFAAAMSLPEDERMQLVEALITSFQPTNRPPLDESWGPVIERRSEELRSGKVEPVAWSEVKRKAREQAGG